MLMHLIASVEICRLAGLPIGRMILIRISSSNSHWYRLQMARMTETHSFFDYSLLTIIIHEYSILNGVLGFWGFGVLGL